MTDPHSSSLGDYMQDLVLNTGDVDEFLNELVRFSVQALSNDQDILCGITLLRHRRAGTVASSSAEAQKTDEIQYKYGAGPCLRASREQTVIYVADMRTEKRWPEYTPVMVKEGILSSLAIPFDLEGETKAAMNLYSREPNYFEGSMRDIVQAHVRQTSKAFRLAVLVAERTERANDLAHALESRTTIDLAVGIVMGQNRCTQDEAFEILKSASSTRNIKLRDLAAQLVTSSGGESARTHFE
ncbi:ANTAR domain-containing protein [Arthrobacter sp. AET 35A]|uniref:GAF and ANTAR domain-containing protein n=2 Tax=unclassified Arthrobacter TaxID=235627 RepID=UPI0014927444|nr:GAF and ANTAR domain-containing protein [Arthrobacter sp. 147(2020)]MBE0010019.1 ANTAR domain-containing protein [Arthrobacter sp. AET 35A]NOJ63898.1 GAF and ANTAR domain-containing protein [Arthrobacter sp. 147(2020)]